MMKKILKSITHSISLKGLYCVFTLFVPTMLSAQNSNILFSSEGFNKVLSNAQKSNKLVFVDCCTSWCGPCKAMAANVFTVDSVAAYFNQNFINVQQDMEKGEGPALLKRYKVEAFPSFLLLNGDGSLVYKFVGAMGAAEFMAKIHEGINPKNKVALMNKMYADGDRSKPFIREYIKLKINMLEKTEGIKIAAEYFKQLPDEERIRPENWFLFGENRYAQYLSSVHTTNFDYLAEHWRDFTRYNDSTEVITRLKSNYRKIAEYSLMGWYFKNRYGDHPYNPAEFEHYKTLISASGWPDKEEYIELMNIASACGRGDVSLVTKTFTQCFDSLSENNQKLVYSYLMRFGSTKVHNGNYGFNEFMRKIGRDAKDSRLAKDAKHYEMQGESN